MGNCFEVDPIPASPNVPDEDAVSSLLYNTQEGLISYASTTSLYSALGVEAAETS